MKRKVKGDLINHLGIIKAGTEVELLSVWINHIGDNIMVRITDGKTIMITTIDNIQDIRR